MAEIIDGGGIGDIEADLLGNLNRIIDGALTIANRNRVLGEIYNFLDGKEVLTSDEIHDIMAKIEGVIEVK